MTTKRLWILGAPDPEMAAIERLLRECGETVAYAVVRDDSHQTATAHSTYSRVHPGNAYTAMCARWPDGSPGGALQEHATHVVECAFAVDFSRPLVVIDHHRPGDSGYGLPPRDFLRASSIGQVIAELARLDLIPSEWILCRSEQTLSVGDMGLHYWVSRSAEWDEVDGMYRQSPASPSWFVRTRGGWCLEIPRAYVFTAAADHCLAAAYRGDCPGVDPEALMEWRVKQRAAFQQRPPVCQRCGATPDLLDPAREAMGGEGPCGDLHDWMDGEEQILSDIRSTMSAIGAAQLILMARVNDIEIRVADMRRDPPYPELPEAACRLDVPYISGPLETPDGRQKIVCSGRSEVVQAFLDHWAPAEGLVDTYGDPARGFAGGYQVGRNRGNPVCR